MENENKETVNAVENLIDEDRVLNFSDAVFAFAATLLVLKIDLPALTATDVTSVRLTTELVNLWPSYFANIISFLIIGYYWLIHHAIFNMVKKIDLGLIWINLIFLIFLSFLPFPVDLFGDYSTSDVVVAFYSFALALVGFLLSAIWFYAVYKKMLKPSVTKKQINFYSWRFVIAPIVFGLSIPLSFIDPLLSKVSWIFVLIGIFVINKLFAFKRLSIIEKESV